MANLIYQIALGETPAFYDICTASVDRYCKRHGLDHIVQTEPILRIVPVKSCRSVNALRLGYLPIYEKEAAFAYLDRYEKIAIIDADVYIRDCAPNIFDQPVEAFGGVLERDLPITSSYADKIRKYSHGQYDLLTDVDWKWGDYGAAFYNMGVMLLGPGFRKYLNGETPEQFVRRPEFERFVNGEGHYKWSADQTLLNYWVKKSGMPALNLDWRWNAIQMAVEPSWLREAYFVHFVLSSKMPRGGAEIPEIISRL